MQPATRWMLAGGAPGLALLAWALWPVAIPVDVAEVKRGPLLVTIDEEGETRVRERYVVSAPAAGRVLRVQVEPGDLVKAGDTLATLQPAPPSLLDARTRAQAEARIAAARAALERSVATCDQAETESTSAETELRRHQDLAEARLLPRDRLDAAEASAAVKAGALRAAEAGVKSAEEELRAARAALIVAGTGSTPRAAMVIRAPVTGTVLRRLRESESIVPAGDPLVELGDTSRLEIVSDLLSTDAVKVSPGQGVLIEGWGGGSALRGVVQRVEPGGFTKISALGVEEQRVNVIVDLADRQPLAERLGDGYRVAVRIVIAAQENVLTVPISSLVHLSEGWRVFVIEQGKAIERVVTIGQRNSLEAEVLSGVSAGEQVILHPPERVEPGAAVRMRP